MRLLAVTVALLASAAPAAAAPADHVFTNGRIYTVDPARPWAQALAIDNGRIVYVGSDAGACRHAMGSAFQMHQDRRTGSLERGKLADLIVLDRNLFRVPADRISGTKVLMTMLGGRVVHGNLELRR